MRTQRNKIKNSGGNYPTRYWWIPLVIVPILVALIGGVFYYWRSLNSKEVITILQSPPENNLTASSNNFQLKMRKEGWPDLYSGERVYEFELFNTGDRIAVTRNIMLEVLSIAPEGPPIPEATFITSEYHILLKHDQVGDYLITDIERKYGKGDIEKFVVGVKSDKGGWQYVLRIKVIWYDPEEEGERILYSDPYTARFYKMTTDPTSPDKGY
jgi:hypothetical protein